MQSLDRRVVNKHGVTTANEVDRHTCRWADFDHDGRLDAYCSLGASDSGPAKFERAVAGPARRYAGARPRHHEPR